MYKMEFFIKGPKLHLAYDALWKLGVYNLSVVPVENAIAKNGKIKAKTTSGTARELLCDHMVKSGKKKIDQKEAAEFLGKIGRQPSSAFFTLRDAVKHQMLRHLGNGTFVLNTAKSASKTSKKEAR